MGLITDLLGGLRGRKDAPRTIAAVEDALTRLSSERAAAREAVAAAMRERDDLLLVDETDARIAELDALADRYRLTLERCDKAEPLLLGELEDLRSAANQARWRDLRAKYDTAGAEYAGALRTAIEKMTTMLNLNDEARRQGFEREVMAAFIPPARVVTIEALNEFEIAIERAREMARPAPAPRPVAPAPKAAAPAPPFAKPKPSKAAAPRPAPKPFTPPEPDANGNVQVIVIRPGIELEGRARPRAGETVFLPAAEAMRAVQSGSADFAEALR